MAQLYPSSYPDASYCHSANGPSSEAPSPSLYHLASSSHAHPHSISGLAAPPPPWSASSAAEYEHHFASTAHGSLKRHLPVQEDLYASSLPKRARADSNVGDIPFYPPWIEANAYSAASTSVYPQRPGEKFCTFYMTTSTCSFGVTCRFDHPSWVPAGGIPNWKENTSSNAKADITSLPVRPSEPDCSFYLKTGECKYGSRCKFNHPENRTAGAVKLKESESQNNQERSPKPEILPGKITQKNPDSVNLNGFPIRNGELDCAFYIKTGSCKYGETCRFNHPEDRSSGSKLPMDITTANKLQDYTVSLPSASVSLSAGTFMPGHPFPLRPGEPECSFYMKTGDCKFKATCRFNHPLNRFDPVYAAKSSVKLNLAGLPRREGQQPCPFYLKTGTCNYKTTCKFDHPSPGEVVAKALASALQAGQDPSVVGSETLPPGVSPTTILS